MNHKEFFTGIISYYGKYSPSMGKTVFEYLKSDYKEKDLDKIFNLILRNFSSQYKTVPDIATIEKIVNEYNKSHDYSGERIERNGEIYYITDNPKYDYLLKLNYKEK